MPRRPTSWNRSGPRPSDADVLRRKLASRSRARYSIEVRRRLMGRRWRDSVRLRLVGQHWRDPERLRLIGLAAVLAVVTTFAVREARRPGPWQRVFATREGLTGHKLACGDLIRDGAMFVALPHRSALHRDVEIRYRDRIAVVPVLD